MKLASRGDVSKIGLTKVVDAFASLDRGSVLRLRGNGIEFDIAHGVRGNLLIHDGARKVRERIGERLVRYGHLSRDVLIELLNAHEGSQARIDFSGHVLATNLESTLMIQALDSIDRLSLSPKLSYEIEMLASPFRGTEIDLRRLLERLDWCVDNRSIFLKWRAAVGEKKFSLLRAPLATNATETALASSLASGQTWDSFQTNFKSPIASIAVSLESLEQSGLLGLASKTDVSVLTIPNLPIRMTKVAFSVLLLSLLLYGFNFSWDALAAYTQKLSQQITQDAQIATESHQIVFWAESFREREGRYPNGVEFRQNWPQGLREAQYIGMGSDFIVTDRPSRCRGDKDCD